MLVSGTMALDLISILAAIPDTVIMGTTIGPITIPRIAIGDIAAAPIAVHMATVAPGGADAAPETGAIATETITAA